MTKDEKIKRRLSELADMPAARLRQRWKAEFGEAAPAVSSNLLRLALGHAAQEKSCGKLSAVQTKFLEGGAAPPEPSIQLKSGTRLVREWNGRNHCVLVCDEGFEFDGKVYPTLSAVAVRITGAHWSGPRFFGLRRRSPPPSK